jgi:hypothetical protein
MTLTWGQTIGGGRRLLDESNPTYLRRLAKEVNKPGTSPRYHGHLVAEGKFSKGSLRIRFVGERMWRIVGNLAALQNERGEQVVASREIR